MWTLTRVISTSNSQTIVRIVIVDARFKFTRGWRRKNTTALALAVGPSQRGADSRAKQTAGWWITAWGWQAG
ncbi:hypothetical protein GCM10009006_34540 [Haloarcula argentinensis]|uniref:Uncharacterized protein n=1 Tax=Haloarcula argentinensis TaxID=43776 RepID=A0A830FLY4_HALAR|nr:hypothetical protein GCM10009006_34540 [Haloarcula argentinensis]